jgi:hypothetical protein
MEAVFLTLEGNVHIVIIEAEFKKQVRFRILREKVEEEKMAVGLHAQETI